MERIQNNETISIVEILPDSECTKKDNRRINQRVRHAKETGKTINFYVGTCPDYSHDGQQYTFDSIGNDVPLLTEKQLSGNKPLFEALEYLWRTI